MRKLLVVIVALSLLTVVAVGVRTLGARDETDPVDADDAAELFAPQDSSDLAPGERPHAGTYTYTGSGRERIDLLGGSEHVFPDAVALVVELDPRDPCRWTGSIVYVRQHVEERRHCTARSVVRELGFTRRVEFFNRLQEVDARCDDDADLLRTDSHAGDTWEWTCRDDSRSTTTSTATALGTEQLVVGGEPVLTWRVRIVSRHRGRTTGRETRELWLAASGLPIRFTGELRVRTRAFLVTSTLRHELSYALTSLVPQTD